MRRWLRARRERKALAARSAWARERAADLRFARASWRLYTHKDS